jgi:two-component system sensor histidine kinase YesM
MKNIRMGIRAKLLLSISAVIFFTITMLIIVIVVNYGSKLENDNIMVSNQIISNLTSNLNDYFDELISITNVAVYSSDLQDLISSGSYIKQSDPNEPDLVKANLLGSEIFGQSFDARKNITSIIVFNGNGILLYKSLYGLRSNLSDYKTQPWYQKAVQAKGDSVISGIDNHSYITGDSQNVFSVSRDIKSYSNQASGVILVDANLNTITNICNSVKLDKNGQIFITDEKGKLLYQPNSDLPYNFKTDAADFKNVTSRFSQPRKGNFNVTIKDEKYQVVYNRIKSCDWVVFTVTPYTSLISDVKSIRNMIVVFGIISLLLIIAVTYLLLTGIIKPLFELKKQMDSADKGNLDFRAEIKTHDEIGMLALSFNHMLDRIESLMNQVVMEQRKIRKSELKALQAQINPHFLYNTLDTIVWMAEMKSNNIVPTTEALAKFFRISLSKGQDMIDIADELEHVRNYLVIQSMRYINKFDYEIVASEKTIKYKTLKIILQPIVENALYHGIKNKPGKGLIKIEVIDKIDNLLVIVSDDGIGMEPEKCRQILEDSYKHTGSDGSGVGIRNVNERIKLYFGREYGVTIESEIGKGTNVYVNLPIITE